MPSSLSAPEVLNREFLEVRCKILELAAALDRLDRADGSVNEDPRMSLLQEGIETLRDRSEGRAERVQMLFSREYEQDWRKALDPRPR